MGNKKGFWLALMVGLMAYYGVALALLLAGHTDARPVLVSAILLVAHFLEIPLAFHMLKGRGAQPLRIVGATLLFGLIWWIPARRGLFALR